MNVIAVVMDVFCNDAHNKGVIVSCNLTLREAPTPFQHPHLLSCRISCLESDKSEFFAIKDAIKVNSRKVENTTGNKDSLSKCVNSEIGENNVDKYMYACIYLLYPVRI